MSELNHMKEIYICHVTSSVIQCVWRNFVNIYVLCESFKKFCDRSDNVVLAHVKSWLPLTQARIVHFLLGECVW
jgi:hypothetical protein